MLHGDHYAYYKIKETQKRDLFILQGPVEILGQGKHFISFF